MKTLTYLISLVTLSVSAAPTLSIKCVPTNKIGSFKVIADGSNVLNFTQSKVYNKFFFQVVSSNEFTHYIKCGQQLTNNMIPVTYTWTGPMPTNVTILMNPRTTYE